MECIYLVFLTDYSLKYLLRPIYVFVFWHQSLFMYTNTSLLGDRLIIIYSLFALKIKHINILILKCITVDNKQYQASKRKSTTKRK